MPWLYPPKEKQSLADVAKLAVTLRAGAIPVAFLDEGFAEVPLGSVGRVQLLAPGDLGLPSSSRKFALARGTSQLCLAEIVQGEAGVEAARDHLDAVARQREKSEGKKVVGWLIAERVTAPARALLAAEHAVASSTGATFVP